MQNTYPSESQSYTSPTIPSTKVFVAGGQIKAKASNGCFSLSTKSRRLTKNNNNNNSTCRDDARTQSRRSSVTDIESCLQPTSLTIQSLGASRSAVLALPARPSSSSSSSSSTLETPSSPSGGRVVALPVQCTHNRCCAMYEKVGSIARVKSGSFIL
ncbi:uncharacterized protein EI90DRAFT_3039183 [Cantharellus anzutake]|uniref:uncharacterized protein n=1 Tax=Cantharellus anzutake TaxID=1750568 RepID=UPI0019049B18|nr:uncharacterized protein EI90DRAFT_3039183 [Cantharellus anzutake]KAF8338790.1 hypothetical protein EI90DRAFT_3039183 [Cantharellus anzutake]